MPLFTVVTPTRVLRVRAASQQAVEAALAFVHMRFLAVAQDRPPRKGGQRRGR
jgi:hypothetical protein